MFDANYQASQERNAPLTVAVVPQRADRVFELREGQLIPLLRLEDFSYVAARKFSKE